MGEPLPGLVRFPWLREGKDTFVPALSTEELAQLHRFERSLLEKEEWRSDLAREIKEAIERAVDVEVSLYGMALRLRKADSAITRDTLAQMEWPTFVDAARTIQAADAINFPRRAPASTTPASAGAPNA